MTPWVSDITGNLTGPANTWQAGLRGYVNLLAPVISPEAGGGYLVAYSTLIPLPGIKVYDVDQSNNPHLALTLNAGSNQLRMCSVATKNEQVAYPLPTGWISLPPPDGWSGAL